MSTFILFFNYYGSSSSSDELDEEEKLEIAEKIWLRYFQNRLEAPGKAVGLFVSASQESAVKEYLKTKYNTEFLMTEFFTSKELLRYIKKNIGKDIGEALTNAQGGGLSLNESGFTADTNDLVSFWLVSQLTQKLTGGVELSEDLKYVYIAHVDKNKTQSVFLPVDSDVGAAKQHLGSSLSYSGTKSMENRLKFHFMDQLQRDYFQEFKKRHWDIEPLDWNEISAYCKEKGIDESKLDYNPARKFIKNAC